MLRVFCFNLVYSSSEECSVFYKNCIVIHLLLFYSRFGVVAIFWLVGFLFWVFCRFGFF